MDPITAGLPPSPPTGVPAYTVGWSHHRSWASMSSPTGLPSPPPTGVSAYTAGLLCRRCWASTTSPPACLHRRLVSLPTRLVGHTTVDGHLFTYTAGRLSCLHGWCFYCHRWTTSFPHRLLLLSPREYEKAKSSFILFFI